MSMPTTGEARPDTAPHPASTTDRPATAAALLGVLGVVYGDIGTSPLYALKPRCCTSRAVASTGLKSSGSSPCFSGP
jgi:KUP system potassium uptake protein